MSREKLIRITTIPLSLEKLLEGQLGYMQQFFDVTGIAAEKERLEKYGANEGVATHHIALTREITPIKDLKAVYKLYTFLRKERPAIVHTHTPKAGIVGMMAAYFARVPNRLHTVAGLPLLEASGFKRIVLNAVEKLTYRFATGVYPNSNGLRQIIIEENFTSPTKLKVLGQGSSNGIDTSYFSSEIFTESQNIQKRKELNIPDDDFVFVFVGRIVRDKGINELVEAFARVQRKHPNCTLLLVGPFEDDLDPVSEETRTTINTHQKIITVGYQADVRPFFAISNALVFPSYREGFPNVVMQAGAMGLPAIVSNINGCNEIISESVNGFIVEPKQITPLENAMTTVLTDKAKYKTLQSNVRAEIVSRYERKHMWQLLHQEYKELLKKN
ncbi:glycosyltransferase family 4 protein [Rasiella rasia]|uniref:Glycosyltransferase family 4 protein n=1 Tax=Rasiella rasia TaxID=2744027 RepID=A0A6G6GKQ3_9FLAO|nr:glycosyltransferase family 4 protein [Rasiella rasia]QIE58271.1 glycosyltransferase family 4 protein [Rasiella rasia]